MNTPRIIKESNSGYDYLSLEDEMFRRRELILTGRIDDLSSFSLITQIRQLQHDSPDEEITIFINSPGGSVQSGLALYDVIQNSSCPVRTVCLGTAASMAAIIFLSGTPGMREIYPHSKVMLHDVLVPQMRGSAHNITKMCEGLSETREILKNLIALHTGIPDEEIETIMNDEIFYTAEEAVNNNIADIIIEKENAYE